MHEHLPVVSGARLVATLQRLGWSKARQRGSHVVLVNNTPDRRILVIPLHTELKRGTLAAILRDAGLTPGELRRLL